VIIEPVEDEDRAPEGVVRVRAPNPSALTLDGTNTYVVGGWVVDPGPDDPGHLERVLDTRSDTVSASGSPARLEGIVLTHGHPDHADAAPPLAERAGGAPVVRPGDGEEVGPFRAIATPGHSPDHVCLLFRRVLFTGDTVLGAGSVFIGLGEGSLSAYLDSLRRLRALELDVLCPGHGPFVWRPREKLDEYLEHRLDRERRLVEALEAGARSREEMLEAAWPEVPRELHPAAALTLEAHLEKLAEEGRLPANAGPPPWAGGWAEGGSG
jgi:glyoxylase-like metal-dependent hydrolase (beta-lactamase superfamily II)